MKFFWQKENRGTTPILSTIENYDATLEKTKKLLAERQAAINGTNPTSQALANAETLRREMNEENRQSTNNS